ncbi:hypothetical protein [Tenacibaculum sp. 190524A05c]|uniref:DUF1772 domain-containing protein n=1 Tax=Tenacibaculum platacis TaxID=3137852 RepID=A0ABM9P486_9FLAO
MNRILHFISIAIFSIFLGSQITEGILLVPYWKSLTTSAFYKYYSDFGPDIGKFYTTLTIISVLITLSVFYFCAIKKSSALKYATLSTFFSLLVILLFYVYFKEVNQQFYQSDFNEKQLQIELNNWSNWHWLRVFFEVLSLVFLTLALNNLKHKSEIN